MDWLRHALAPKRQPIVYWIFLVLAVTQAGGTVVMLFNGRWGLGLFNIAVIVLLASVPFRLAR